MSDQSSFVSGTLRLLLMLAVGACLLFQIGSGDSEHQSRQQAAAFGLDEEGLVRSLHVSSEGFDAALLPQLSRLRKLTITDRTVDPVLAEQITDTDVRALILEGCEVLPGAVSVLTDGLPELTELSLAGSDGASDLSELLTVPCRLLNLSDCPWVTDSDLVTLTQQQPRLESLKLAGTGVSGAASSILSRCAELAELDVSRCALQGSEFVSGVYTMPALRNLNVCDAAISLQQLRAIQDGNRNLRVLFAPGTCPELEAVREQHPPSPEFDDGVRLFASSFKGAVVHDDGNGLRYDGLRWIPATTSITFAGAGVTDRKVDFVRQMSQLRSLDFAGTSITDSTLQQIVRLAQLTALDLSGTQVTDEGIALLKKLPNLKEIDLADTQLTDTGLQELTATSSLQFLNISGTQVSAAGLQWLVDLPLPPRVKWSGLQIPEMSESLLRRLQSLTDTLEVSSNNDLNEFLLPGLCFTAANIEGAILSNAQIDILATWPDLRSLKLSNCRFESDRPDLSLLSHVWFLQLADCGLTDELLKSISLPDGVGNLDLSGNSIREFDPGQLALGPSPYVNLSKTDASVLSVRRLLATGLSRLNVGGVGFNDLETGIVPLPDRIRLPSLSLSFDKSSVDLFSRLGVLQRLSSLDIYVEDGAEITHSIVAPLVSSRTLNSVTIHGRRQMCTELQDAMKVAGYSGYSRCVSDCSR